MALVTLTCGHIASARNVQCMHASHGTTAQRVAFDAEALADRVQRWQAREDVRMTQQAAELGALQTPRRLQVARILAVLAMVLGMLGAGTAVASSASAADAPMVTRGARTLHVASVPTCSAYVQLWEDGSWSGTALEVNGVRVADRWDVTGPEARGGHVDAWGMWSYGVSFPAALEDGTRCDVRDARELEVGAEALGTAQCTASVVLWEDGTWMGTALEAYGVHIADRWDVQAPHLQGTVTDGVAHVGWVPTWGTAGACTYGL